ncbi:hypothetical protein [Streptomyces sp. 4F14]|uniref:hypothetical protein n=1 Tax=Streptomyces sp. 4F14 TaxID=3394380 RepID=UPI003A8891FE
MPATIVMPDRDEISRRIAQADPSGAARMLYPGILDMAGKELHGSGVAVGLSLVILNHMEEHDYGRTSVVMMTLLKGLLPRFVTALVDDEQARADALAILEEARASRR